MSPAEFNTLVRAEKALWWFRGMQSILLRMLEAVVSGRRFNRVLEAGCGTGHFARVLEQYFRWRVFPTDLSSEGLTHARDAGIARLAQADIAALPYAAGCFDAVLSLDVLVHFERGNEAAPLSEFARVLAPQGLLVIRVSALDVLRSRHSQLTCERQRFTRKRLAQAVRRQGFRVLRCTYANSLLLPVALAKFRIWEPLLRKPPQSGTALVPRWLDRLLYVPLAAESRWLGAGMNFAAGQSLILIAEKS